MQQQAANTERNYSLFEDALLVPLRGHTLTELEQIVAVLLLEATSQHPITNRQLRVKIQCQYSREVSDREVKAVIRDLRKDHQFPIVARRGAPAGYFWCAAKGDMEAFIKEFRTIALDELHTLSRIVKANFPELAGQLRLDTD